MTARLPVLLTYRTLGLGDLLTAVPALRALRSAFAGHRHVLAAPGWLAPLVRTLAAVDQHLAVEELAPVPLEPGSVDVAVNLHGSGPESHRVLRRLHPGRLVAFRPPDAADTAHAPALEAAPSWRDDEHEVDRWCRLLEAAGIPADASDLELSAAGPVPDGAAGATVVHPGAKAGARRWPADRFAAVAASEHRRGRRVVVTGSADEEPLARRVADEAGLPTSSVLAGSTDVGELAGVVAAAGRVVCGDTGVAHLATAYATPSVVLFGPSPPSLWGPPADRRDRHRVLWSGRRGDPLGEQPDPGLLEITVDQVLAELDRLPPPVRQPATASTAGPERS